MTRYKYSSEDLLEAVNASNSFAGVLRYLGIKQAGGSQAHLIRRIKKEKMDTSHFLGQGHLKGRQALNRKSVQEILVVGSEFHRKTNIKQLRRAMVESGIELKCNCGLTDEWQGQKLQLEVDHINGMWWDNRIENLRFICPNCHSQCETTNKPNKYKSA